MNLWPRRLLRFSKLDEVRTRCRRDYICLGEIPLSLRSPFQGLCDVCLLLAAAELCLVRPMRAALVFLALTFAAIAGTLPDDAVLSQRLVGVVLGMTRGNSPMARG